MQGEKTQWDIQQKLQQNAAMSLQHSLYNSSYHFYPSLVTFNVVDRQQNIIAAIVTRSLTNLIFFCLEVNKREKM